MEAEKFTTAPQVMARLFEKHPEIIQIAVASYVRHRHGTKATDFEQRFIPITEETPGMAEGQWRKTYPDSNEIVAIGSTVAICPRTNCDHSIEKHGSDQDLIWYLWHDEGVTGAQGPQKSFIFLDLESRRPEILERSVEILKNLDCDWYISNSGRGFHVILDKLVDFSETPSEYGKIIALFGERTGDESLARWGEHLKEDGSEPWRVQMWCNWVLELCGHIGEKLHGNREETHLIDLRHIAHGLQGFQRYFEWLKENPFDPEAFWQYSYLKEIGGVYLRISPKKKRELPPVLVAQKEAQICTLWASGGRIRA